MVSNWGMRLAALAVLLVAVWLVPPASAQKKGPTLEDRLLGNWACVSGPCGDPEIQFARDDGRRVYNSWLHERPSASGGSWTLAGNRLSMSCCGHASPSEWVVMRVSEKHLHLRPAGSKENAVFRRLK
jgi:hypothetical protein